MVSSGVADVDTAVTSARTALPHWAAMSGFERGQVLKRAADLIRVRKPLLSLDSLDFQFKLGTMI